MIDFESVQLGDDLPELVTKPISRTTLALFAGASGDHNPIHIDIDFAKKSGMEDVFVHGMLSMAYLSRLLIAWVPQTAIQTFAVRFASITQLHASITCRGKVVEKFERDGIKLVKVSIEAADETGDIKLAGEAEIKLD